MSPSLLTARRGGCRCLKQDGQDVQDGQDKERPRCGGCKCLKQDGQDAQDGQDKSALGSGQWLFWTDMDS